MEEKYKIDVYCLCWNEEAIIPFVIQYWKRFARHVYVYDNGSTDKSIELLSQYPDWITIEHFDSESEGFDDITNLKIKNDCWKGSDADWVVVCDFDECLYSKNLTEFLGNLDRNDFSVIAPQWTDVWSKDFPEYDEGKLCHEITDGVVPDKRNHLHKCILFKPGATKEMNYGAGCHFCRHVGEGKTGMLNDGIYLVHLKNLGIDYRIKRYGQLKERLSERNKRYGFGVHYFQSDDEIRKEFEENLKKEKLKI